MSIDVTVAKRIEGSKVPEDFFGDLAPPESAQRDAIAVAYKRVVLIVHPDKHAGTPHETTAKDLFRRVTELKDQALRKVEAKTYGKKHVASPDEKKPAGPIVVEIKKKRYVLGDVLYSGDVADLYACSWGADDRGLFKIVKNAGDNDLVENEGRILEKLGMAEDHAESVYKLFPRLHDSFTLKGKSGSRRVLIIGHYSNHLSLAEIIEAYPDGVDFRDAAWMWKRMLFAVGHAHRRGIMHGGITPDHVLVHPTEHGAKILDWTSAVTGGHVKLISKKWKDNYPPEVMAKRPASAATDIYMVSACVEELLGLKAAKHEASSVPPAIRDFLKSCLIPAQGRRPDDAWQLHEELDELLKALVGKRKYREFKMPAHVRS